MPPPLPLSCDRPDIMTEHDILELLRLPLPKLQALASEADFSSFQAFATATVSTAVCANRTRGWNAIR